MRKFWISLAVAFALVGWSGLAWTHPGHEHRSDQSVRTWNDRSGIFHIHGSFVSSRDGKVQIRQEDDSLLTIELEKLSDTDQQWVAQRIHDIRRANLERVAAIAAIQEAEPIAGDPVLLIAQRGDGVAGQTSPNRGGSKTPEIASAFEPFAKLKAVSYRWDDRWLYVESNGIPDHPMMIGITAWQQQVPLPQKYFGANAWQIPLHPVPAKESASAKGRFLRGAIAVAVNGIPIFNPLNNRGDDAYLFGELDEYGGHCGRADDYHYHLAPVHLEKQVGKGKVIAYALDGYPIYGYDEADGKKVVGLDWLNGHKDEDGHYHYHATKTYPYLNGGFYGEVIERAGQVDPQPRAEGVREALPPLRGAKIVGFKETKPSSYLLTYEMSGREGTVGYTINADGTVAFKFTDTSGTTTNESYQPRRRPPGGENPPPRPRENRPRRPGDDRPAPREENPPPRDGDQLPRDGKSALGSIPSGQSKLTVSSSAIGSNRRLPIEFTCDGAGISPPVEWSGAPKETKFFAVSLWHTAPDREKSYWVVYNIPANVNSLKKNSTSVGKMGLNDKKRAAYDPMCSKGPGVKEYHVTVFALSSEVKLPPEQVTRTNLLQAIQDITLAEGTFTYQYERAGKD